MARKLIIPGWRGKIDVSRLQCFRIEFNDDSLESSTLVYYIKRGEYLCDFPFGIFKKDSVFFLITFHKDIKSKKLIIKSYIGEVIGPSNQEFSEQSDAISCFIHTLLDDLYIQYGFERPIDTRSFLGKAAKGKLSYRKEIVETFSIQTSSINYKTDVYKSVNHEVFINNNDFTISFLPNYEIYGNFFDLPLNKEEKKHLEEDKKWKDLVYLDYNKFQERFLEYSKFLYDNLKKISLFWDLILNPAFKHDRLKYPEKLTIKCINTRFELVNYKPFKDQLLNIFKNNCDIIPTIKISIYIDNFNLSESEISHPSLELYLKKIKSMHFFQINEIIYFNDKMEIGSNPNKTILLILNNEIPGYEFLYTLIKKKANVSKIVNISTIKEIDNYLEHFLTIWLSFKFRQGERLIWKSFRDYTFEKAISFRVHFDQDFELFKVVGFILNLSNGKLQLINERFEPYFKNRNRIDLIQEIKEKLMNKYNFDLSNDLFIFEQGNYTINLINVLKNDSVCVLIERPSARMFLINEKTDDIPENGCFIQLFEKNPTHFLLITTGLPDKPEYGLPNPISIKIISKSKKHIIQSQYKDILQIIFDLSFYQPESFSKVNVPFLIPYMNRILFRKIPYNFPKRVEI